MKITHKIRLVVNADDFGLTPGVNYGIVEAFNYGILTSTTLMVNQPYVLHAVELSKKFPKLSVGIHLTFDKGYSLSGTSTLTDLEGKFLKYSELKEKGKEEDYYKEGEAQLKYFMKIMGKKPTHIDSHHHIHLDFPEANKAILKLCENYGLSYRNREILNDSFYKQNVSVETLCKIINEKRIGHLEIMCHPAFIDKELVQTSSYNDKRLLELEVLKNDKVKSFVEQNCILVNFLNQEKSIN